MKELSDFKNIHKGKDIYVLASGKSMDFIDKSFFDNKIIIGINQAFKKTNCTYLLRKEYEMLDSIIKNNSETIHFISKGAGGAKNTKNLDYIKKHFNLNNIICYDHNANNCKNIPSIIKENELIVSYSTITTGIHLAAYMGAKNIIICGHDCGCINGEPNFKGYHTDQTYKIIWKNGKNDYKLWLKKIEKDTINLKKLLMKTYNCNICSLNPFINFGLEGNKYTR